MLRSLPSIVIRVVLAVLLTGCITLLVTPAASLAAKTIDIAAARQLPLGTVVTIKGSVTVPPGAFSSSFFDQGFAVQDRTGGIYVSIQTNLGLHIRQQIEVTGQLADSFGLLILVPTSPADVQKKGKGPKVEAAEVTTGAIGEATEGQLVQVEGTVSQPVSNDLPYGYFFSINDGSGEIIIFVNTPTGIDVSALHPGQHVEVTGLSSQFDTHYEIDPRIPTDIQVQ